jgi:ATP-dependent Clp protease ATP-binding subunit ClpX
LETIIGERIGKKGIGFGSALKERDAGADFFRQVLPEDLRKFGLIPEFIGRLPVIATVEELDRSALIQILTEPKNALIKQYQRVFEIDGYELEFDPAAIELIADKAVKRETGARGLRAILEEILGPMMFELPGSGKEGRVVVTADQVAGAEAKLAEPRQRLKGKSA